MKYLTVVYAIPDSMQDGECINASNIRAWRWGNALENDGAREMQGAPITFEDALREEKTEGNNVPSA